MPKRMYIVKIELKCKSSKNESASDIRKSIHSVFDDFQEDSLKIEKLTVKEMSKEDRREEI